MKNIPHEINYPDDAAFEGDSINASPFSSEAEQSVLASLLVDSTSDSWDMIDGKLHANDFYQKQHAIIFEAIGKLHQKGEPVDLLTLSDFLSTQGKLEEAGGTEYLAELSQRMTSSGFVLSYASLVREYSVIRRLIQTGQKIVATAHNREGMSIDELIQFAEQEIFAIAEQGNRANEGGLTPVSEVMKLTLERIEELSKSTDGITGVPTDWADFDQMTAGLQAGDMIVVAGRPSMGKTTFAMNMVERVAMYTKRPVAVFSLEMPAEQLMMRMFASVGRIEQENIRSGQLNESELKRLSTAMQQLNETKIFIDDTSGLTPNELRSRARRLKRDHGDLALIMIDYMQLMTVPGLGSNQKVAEVSEISRSIKLMARELNVPVIVLSQLNRSLEQRPNKRPVMSDLRDSGAIEQDADLICFIYRDEVYNEDSPDKGIAEVIIGKQRNGPIGTVRLAFQGQYSTFTNADTMSYGALPDLN